MKQLDTQKGFTLVELAIVMTIIGLLIGGILKGQELMQNARVTSTIAQVRAYEAATTTFRDKYDAIPGDMANAQNRIPGCNDNCAPNPATAGNTIIGAADWGDNGYLSQGAAAVTTPPNAEAQETQLYWAHLLLADLISGVTNAAINGQTPALGETHPSAKIGGGFVVGYADGTVPPGAPAGGTGPAGMVLALVQGPATDLSTNPGVQPLTPTRAAQIDRKMDDGRPVGGFVQAYGVSDSCYNEDDEPNTPASPGYLENSTANDCGLIFRIQG